MTLSELIARLRELREHIGDVEVRDEAGWEIEEARFRETEESRDSRHDRWVEVSA